MDSKPLKVEVPEGMPKSTAYRVPGLLRAKAAGIKLNKSEERILARHFEGDKAAMDVALAKANLDNLRTYSENGLELSAEEIQLLDNPTQL